MSVPYKLLHLLFVSLFVFATTGTVFAQEESLQTIQEASQVDVPDGTNDTGWGGTPSDELNDRVNCFDYYTFQSVQVSIDPVYEHEQNTFAPGDEIEFEGKVINENDQPVANGYVYARVTKENKNYKNEGDYIQDEFFALEEIALNNNEEKPVSFTWKLPEQATGGNYDVKFFFSVGKKFNLGGLPFSNEIIIGSAGFVVESEKSSAVTFDRSATEINGEAYAHIGNWPNVEPSESVVVSQSLENSHGVEKEVTVTYDLYYWDSLDESDLINSTTETVVVPANETINLEYTVPSMSESVYYLKMTATAAGEKSIVNIRFVSNQESPRLNYPGVTKFPVKEGENLTLFSCFHNTSQVKNEGKVVTTLYDKEGNELAEALYEGLISPVMNAHKTDFEAMQDYEYFLLKAVVYDSADKEVDRYEVEYDCADFNNCKPPEHAPVPVPTDDGGMDMLLMLSLFIAVVIIIFVILGYGYMRKEKSAPSVVDTGSEPMSDESEVNNQV